MEKRNDEAARFGQELRRDHANSSGSPNPFSSGAGHRGTGGDGLDTFKEGYYHATQEALSVLYEEAREFSSEGDYEAARVIFDITRTIEERLSRREKTYGTTQEDAEKALDLFEHVTY